MCVCVCAEANYLVLCLMHFMEHEFSGDACFRAVDVSGPALERCYHLLHDLIEEHGGELRVQDRAELKRDLDKGERKSIH